MKHIARMAAAAITIASLNAGAALAQSHAGTWEGTVTTQQGGQPATVTLDSTATGWQGSVLAPMFQGQAMPFSSVSVKGDTVSMTMNVQNASVGMRGLVATDTHQLNGRVWVDGNEVGSFTFTRKVAAPSANPPQH